MTNTATDPTVFEGSLTEITLDESDLLGTHTYHDVLYTGDCEIVDVQTGKTPAYLNRSVTEAEAFANRTQHDGQPPRVAKRQPPERAVESRSPYVSAAFFHYSITGSQEWHDLFHNAWDSDAYTVEVTPDYSTGTLTIEVKRSR